MHIILSGRRVIRILRVRIFHALIVMLIAISFFLFSIPRLAEAFEVYGQKKNFKLSVSAISQFDVDIDEGGDFNVNRYLFQLGWYKRISDTLNTGISFHYDLHDYSFSKSTALEYLTKLKKLQSFGLGTNIIYTINDDWRLVVIPSIEASKERDADLEDSLIYGGIFSAGYRVSPNFMIGTGIGVFHRLEEVSLFPVVIINWKITDHLILSNPFSGGPTTPAGLELSYAFNKSWTIACGGGYKSYRFRLKDEGTASNGILQEKAVPVWGRVTFKSGELVTVNLTTGAFLTGRLKIEDQDGHEISEYQYDTVPFIAMSVSLTF